MSKLTVSARGQIYVDTCIYMYVTPIAILEPGGFAPIHQNISEVNYDVRWSDLTRMGHTLKGLVELDWMVHTFGQTVCKLQEKKVITELTAFAKFVNQISSQHDKKRDKKGKYLKPAYWKAISHHNKTKSDVINFLLTKITQ